MRTKLIPAALAAVLTLSACGSGDAGVSDGGADPTGTSQPPTTESAPTTTATTSPDVDLPVPTEQGVITIRLEKVDGIFIEGFEAGIRIETIEGDVLLATLWSDFVNRQANPTFTDYYESVLEQSVQAGEIVVLATVNVGLGPAPVRPDVNGEMACRLVLEVPADGVVEVELVFSGRDNCLSVIKLS